MHQGRYHVEVDEEAFMQVFIGSRRRGGASMDQEERATTPMLGTTILMVGCIKGEGAHVDDIRLGGGALVWVVDNA